MADRILREKIIAGKIVFPPVSELDDWSPSELCNDFYPKIITDLEENFLFKNNLDYYDQKNDFLNIILSKEKIVIEPAVAGWGITFENISIVFKNKKYIVHARAIQNKDVKFNDSFYRFSSMYTFENKINATSENKQKFLIKSWKYNK
jgi:hypothetical protein